MGTVTVTVSGGTMITNTATVSTTTAEASMSNNSASTTTTARNTVTNVTPTSGPTGGNTLVTITGTGFQMGATVRFGGTAATMVMVQNATTITARTPAHASGPVSVVVTTTNGSGTLMNGYTYAP